MGAGLRRGSPCIGDQLHLVIVDKLLVDWVIGHLGRGAIKTGICWLHETNKRPIQCGIRQ